MPDPVAIQLASVETSAMARALQIGNRGTGRLDCIKRVAWTRLVNACRSEPEFGADQQRVGTADVVVI